MAASLFRDFGLADRLLELALERVFVEIVPGDFSCSGVRTKGGGGKEVLLAWRRIPSPTTHLHAAALGQGSSEPTEYLPIIVDLPTGFTPHPNTGIAASRGGIHVPGRKTMSPTPPIGETGDDAFWMRPTGGTRNDRGPPDRTALW